MKKCFECGQECDPKYHLDDVYFCSYRCAEAFMGLDYLETCCVCGNVLMDTIYIDNDRCVYCSPECALEDWGIEQLAAQVDSKEGKSDG